MTNTILDFLDSTSERVITLQRAMTALPALSPDNNGTGERLKADYILSELYRLGVTNITHIDAHDPRTPDGTRPNIAARIPGKSNRTLWIISHMDVVPPGDAALWKTDPWTLHVDGDMVYGRGVEDNQQSIVSGLLVAEALQQASITPEIGLGLLFVADEETGNEYGITHVIKSRPDLFAANDLVIVPDFGNNDGSMVEIAEKGMFWVRVQVTGQQCHASTPDAGVNSLIASSAMILRCKELHNLFPAENMLFSPPCSTFTPTKKEANVPNINTVPGSDVFYIDCRVLPCYTLEAVRQALQSIANEIETEYGVHIVVSDVLAEPAAPATSIDSEVVTRLFQAIRSIYNVEPRPMGVGGGTVGALLRHMGLPVAVWSKLMPNPHVPNECSRISATINDAKVIYLMLSSAS